MHDFAMVIRDGTLGDPKRPPAIASEKSVEKHRETMNGAATNGLPDGLPFSHINPHYTSMKLLKVREVLHTASKPRGSSIKPHAMASKQR